MTPLLEQLMEIADKLGLPFEVGLYTATPAPQTYLVATPLTDVLDVFADNQPSVEVEEVRLALFTRGNYLDLHWTDDHCPYLCRLRSGYRISSLRDRCRNPPHLHMKEHYSWRLLV